MSTATYTEDHTGHAGKPRAANGATDLLTAYHAAAAGCDGQFILFCAEPAKTAKSKGANTVQRFRIGDAGAMAAEAVGRSRTFNSYFGPALMRNDLARGKRGEERDIVAVLALVLEEDADTNKYLLLPPEIEPTFEVRTGRTGVRNRHCHFVFDRPLPPQEAKELAALAYRKYGGDTCGGDITHVWRVPDTLNHPDWRKLARGRPPEPQAVRLTGGTGEFINVEALRAALEAMPDLHRPERAETAGQW